MARNSTRDLKRRPAKKSPRLRILVVSEGAKTEGIYLSLFIRQLNAANVAIDILGRECGSDPQTVVEFARDRFLQDSGYDICFCVIDRDNHPILRFSQALSVASSVNLKSRTREFTAIISDPCIEFWFLLHYVYWRAPFVNRRSKSRADCAIAELKRYIPQYGKANAEELAALVPLTSDAIRNSKRASADAVATAEANPSTMMHDLIERIISESRK